MKGNTLEGVNIFDGCIDAKGYTFSFIKLEKPVGGPCSKCIEILLEIAAVLDIVDGMVEFSVIGKEFN